jgi:hypothetical protein
VAFKIDISTCVGPVFLMALQGGEERGDYPVRDQYSQVISTFLFSLKNGTSDFVKVVDVLQTSNLNKRMVLFL